MSSINTPSIQDCHRKHELVPIPTSEDPVHRAFDPTWNELYRDSPSDIIGTRPHCQQNKLKVRSVSPEHNGVDGDSIVIAIYGAFMRVGPGNARASFGVFYGPNAEINFSALLPSNLRQTLQVAEIHAAFHALKVVQDTLQSAEGGICKVLILNNSPSLLGGISRLIWRWKENGFRTTNNTPVAYSELFVELDELVQFFERQGTPVWFWHVKRELNQEAARLAEQALDAA